jgi:lipopolysaccharide export system permease protein
MLFQSSIRRELARSFGATVVVLVTIVMTIVLIRTLGQASRGSISPQDVMLFMAYSALGRLPTILTLALFLSMVNALSRMYRDSEMVVWFTSGQSLASLLQPLFRFAWPVLAVVAMSSLFVWPWANQQTRDMQIRYQQRSDLDRVAPGQFQESSSGNRVFFIDRNSNAQQDSSNVFIAANEKGKSSVTTAQSGRLETREGSQFLMLENGQRLENEIGKSSLRISEFEEYGTRTGDSNDLGTRPSEAKLLSTRDLIKTPSLGNLGELAWRVGLALSALNFVILAVALSSVNPRGGRGGNTLFVLLAFVVYNNLLNLGQSWILVGLVTFGQFLLALHGGILLLATLWLAKRHYNWTFRTSRPTKITVNMPARALKDLP